MNPTKEKILVIEKHQFVSSLIKEVLEKEGFSLVEDVQSFEDAKNIVFKGQYSLILLDSRMASSNGYDLLAQMRAKKPQTPVIMMVEPGVVDQAVGAMRRGAFDILEKPLHPEKLVLLVKRALEFGFMRTEIVRVKQEPLVSDTYHSMVGRSQAMKTVFDLIERIRESSVNVLITGPSGSGKEMVARALHETSSRSQNRFVAINCSAIPDTLLEGELFGYKKGAFTDARSDKVGLFQEAHGGTIFLDEIGDMPITIQPKILRAIQEKEIRPLGTTQSIKINVRIIAATNQHLEDKIKEKLFREDLYYRLNAMQFDLPSLAERVEDIPLLVDYFLEALKKTHAHNIKGVTQKAMKLLLDYSWPGNVRELENVIERASLFSRNEWILPEDLLFSKVEETQIPTSEWAKRKRPLSDVEKDYILEVLDSVGGNRSETAHILGIGRKTLYNKLAKYGI